MITHNGTYLGAATHHGMPIYAATMGGKMILDGKWLQPATQLAILAAFGAEGTEVIAKTNDYLNRIATTDPQRALQISGFINEDPMLVCSLVETSKVRGLLFDGNTYIDTGIVGNTITNMSMKMYWTEVENGYHINGSADNMQIGVNANKWHNYNTSSTAFQVGKYADIVAEVKDGKWNTYVDGQQILSFSTPSRGTTYTHTIGCWNGSQGKLYWCKQVVAEAIVNDHRYLPFRRNGQMELLDILNGTLATRVGTFTEQLTPKTTS